MQATLSKSDANFSLEAPATLAPAITWLNMSGDVTITWDDENREHIKELVRQKMKEGYVFFVLEPRFIPLLGNKKKVLKDDSQLDNATGVVVPDEQVHSIVSRLGDPDLEKTVSAGKAQLVPTSAARPNYTAAKKATTAEEVVKHQTVSVRPIFGG